MTWTPRTILDLFLDSTWPQSWSIEARYRTEPAPALTTLRVTIRDPDTRIALAAEFDLSPATLAATDWPLQVDNMLRQMIAITLNPASARLPILPMMMVPPDLCMN